MRRAGILVVLCIFFLNLSAGWVSAFGRTDISNQPKLTVVAFINRDFRESKPTFEIIKQGLRKKFGQSADIIYYGDTTAKSPAFLEFMEKVQTDPVNDRHIVWIKEEYVRKFGQDSNSKFVIIVNLKITGYNGFNHYWSKLLLSAYDVEAAKSIAIDALYKGRTINKVEGAEYYMKKLQNEFVWPITPAVTETAVNDTAKPAVVVFIPDDIMEMEKLVAKIKTTVAAKFKVGNVPVYIDHTPKSPAFLNLVNKVSYDSAKQNMIITRKEYLADYGKLLNCNPVIAIKIGWSERGSDGWNFKKPTFLFKEEIVAVDTQTNKYILSTVYSTDGKKGRNEGIEILMNKLQTEFVLPQIHSQSDSIF